MTIASTSRSTVAYIAESTFGTTPATPTFKKLRRTNGNLTTKKTTVVSDEVQVDRNVRDELQVAQDVSGSYDLELSYGTLDDILEGVALSAWSSDVLKNGTTGKSFTFEETVDVGGSNTYSRFPGCYIDQLSLTVSSRALVKGSVSIMGLKETLDTAIISGATYTADNSNVIETGVTVASLSVAGLSPAPKVKSIAVTIKNNLRIRDTVGSLYTEEFGMGQCDVTGTLEAYFESNALYQKVLDHGSGSISFTIGSVTTKKYTFTMPLCRFLDGAKKLGGKNDDVMVSIPFRATYDATSGASITITRAVA